MKKYYTFLVALVLFSACKKKAEKTVEIEAEPTPDFIVAFGSCNMAQEPNPFWDDILAENPNVWIWGGDIVYADTDDVDRLRSIYAMQDTVAGYNKLKQVSLLINFWSMQRLKTLQ